MDVKKEPDDIVDTFGESDVSCNLKLVKTEVEVEWENYESLEETEIPIKYEPHDFTECSSSGDQQISDEINTSRNDNITKFDDRDGPNNLNGIKNHIKTEIITERSKQYLEITIDEKSIQQKLLVKNRFSKEIRIILKRVPCFKKNFVCVSCHKVFNTSDMLKIHKNMHMKYTDEQLLIIDSKKRFVCDFCPYRCGKANDLKRHVLTHSGEKPFECDICLYKFTTSDNLKRHKMKHSGEKPFECDFCFKKCMTSDNLKRHRMIHTGEKPFKCDECEFKCILSSSLKRHRLIHSGEKPYACDVCPRRFRSSGNLRDHKLIHAGNKQFKCDLCPLQFVLNSYLRQHKKIHNDDYPYRCDFCSYKGTRPSYLKQHKLLIHSID